MAETPEQRVLAVVRASFSAANFKRDVMSAWLNFYVAAQNSDEAKRLLRIYQRRIVSNLAFGLRPLIGSGAMATAERLAALIDGIYLRVGLGQEEPDGSRAEAMVLDLLKLETAQISN